MNRKKIDNSVSPRGLDRSIARFEVPKIVGVQGGFHKGRGRSWYGVLLVIGRFEFGAQSVAGQGRVRVFSSAFRDWYPDPDPERELELGLELELESSGRRRVKGKKPWAKRFSDHTLCALHLCALHHGEFGR